MTRDSDSAKRPLSRRQFVGGALLSAGWLTLALAGCAPNATEQTEESATTDEQEHGSVSTQAEAMSTTPTENAARQLVLVFSRAGENYNVGTVETGNTMVIAQMIEERTGADLFELKPEEPYPSSYDETLDRARQEQSANARPALEALPDFSNTISSTWGFPSGGETRRCRSIRQSNLSIGMGKPLLHSTPMREAAMRACSPSSEASALERPCLKV